MNPSWSVGCPAHAYETPSRSLPLFHEEAGEEKKKNGDTQILPSRDRIYFLLVLSCFPRAFAAEPGFWKLL